MTLTRHKNDAVLQTQEVFSCEMRLVHFGVKMEFQNITSKFGAGAEFVPRTRTRFVFS